MPVTITGADTGQARPVSGGASRTVGGGVEGGPAIFMKAQVNIFGQGLGEMVEIVGRCAKIARAKVKGNRFDARRLQPLAKGNLEAVIVVEQSRRGRWLLAELVRARPWHRFVETHPGVDQQAAIGPPFGGQAKVIVENLLSHQATLGFGIIPLQNLALGVDIFVEAANHKGIGCAKAAHLLQQHRVGGVGVNQHHRWLDATNGLPHAMLIGGEMQVEAQFIALARGGRRSGRFHPDIDPEPLAKPFTPRVAQFPVAAVRTRCGWGREDKG